MTEKKGRARKEIKDERIGVRKFEKGKLNRGIDKQKWEGQRGQLRVEEKDKFREWESKNEKGKFIELRTRILQSDLKRMERKTEKEWERKIKDGR